MTNTPILRPASFAELEKFAEMAAKSSFVPTQFRGKPEDLMLAVQMGSELGLSPMQAIQNITVVNGRPSVFGDAMLAIAMSHPHFEDIVEKIEGNTAICQIKRRGRSPIERRFSMEDATRAGLVGKDGPWKTYPLRMLQMRARGFALRDCFPDILRGLILAEEAGDYVTIEQKSAMAPDSLDAPNIDPSQVDQHAIDHVTKMLSSAQDIDALEAAEKKITDSIKKAHRQGKVVTAATESAITALVMQRRESMEMNSGGNAIGGAV